MGYFEHGHSFSRTATLLLGVAAAIYLYYEKSKSDNFYDFYEHYNQHAHRVPSSGEDTTIPFRHRAYSEGYLGGFW